MRPVVTFSLATLLVIPTISCAQETGSGESGNRGARGAGSVTQERAAQSSGAEDQKDDVKGSRRLESVTWNSVKHELTWVISKGVKNTGTNYKPQSTENYLINMDDATMSVNGEIRRFSKEEAANVHVLMDVIAKYAVDSTVWWDEGQGEPLNGPPKKNQRHHNQDNDNDNNVAILHVSATAPAPSDISPAELARRIRILETKLAELKQMQLMLGASELSTF